MTWIMMALVGMVVPVAANAQSITFFEYEGFGGRQVSTDQSIANFDPLGFNDTANAVKVRRGNWQICDDAFFRGQCTTLSPGEYPNLGAFGMRNSVSSARLLGSDVQQAVIPAPTIPEPMIPAPVIPAPAPYPSSQYEAPPQYQPPPRYAPPPQYQPPAAYVAPQRVHPPVAPLILYDEYDFGGLELPVNVRIDNLDLTHWNDRAVSMIIYEGNWQLCTDAYYRGSCTVFGPGSYRDLGNSLVRQVSSLRPADNRPLPPSSNYPPPVSTPYPPVAPPPPRGARAILFSEHDLRGANFALDGDIPNFDRTGFNDRTSSIRVEDGYWLFCSDANSRGDCRIFGPGDYPNLANGFEGRISSARRVAGPGG